MSTPYDVRNEHSGTLPATKEREIAAKKLDGDTGKGDSHEQLPDDNQLEEQFSVLRPEGGTVVCNSRMPALMTSPGYITSSGVLFCALLLPGA